MMRILFLCNTGWGFSGDLARTPEEFCEIWDRVPEEIRKRILEIEHDRQRETGTD